jgi:hypothetical protein
MQRTLRTILATTVALSLAACAGKDGPAGLTGPTGPVGPSGPGTRLVLTAPIGSNGGAVVTLPAAAGTLANPPALGCYYTQPGSTVLVAVASTASTTYPFCGLVQGTGTTILNAVMSGSASGYTAVFVVVY